jgi:hypothetical protein
MEGSGVVIDVMPATALLVSERVRRASKLAFTTAAIRRLPSWKATPDRSTKIHRSNAALEERTSPDTAGSRHLVAHPLSS